MGVTRRRMLQASGALLGVMMVVGLSGCCGGECGIEKTPLTDKQKKYEGHWEGEDGATIDIWADGSGSFRTGGSMNKSVTGGSVTIKGKSLTIGLFGIEESWTIDASPKAKEGKTVMTLSGTVFERTGDPE
ncbi:MAG: hypothetical protein AAFS10_12730 [Myxococcota bacterium]